MPKFSNSAQLIQLSEEFMIRAYAAFEPRGELKPFAYDPGELRAEDVEIQVESCGICHSDLSMIDNEWGLSQYPLIAGHEVVGKIVSLGKTVKTLQIGQRVGVGWFSRSCMDCEWCLSGNHNLCLKAEGTIVARHGGFADRVRTHHTWAIPLPDGINQTAAGPLFCGGITVFNPILQFNIKPVDQVGVIGIGGLGHMAIRFLRAWGCDVTAFSSSPSKETEAKQMGANHFVNSRDSAAIQAVMGTFDVILATVNVDLDWDTYIAALRPMGRLHFVGAVPNPVSTTIFPMLLGQKSISGSPLGSPTSTQKMLNFAARHGVEPIVEYFSFDRINEALDRLRSGKARYRIVLHH
jgi:alcohol/geraniol dehydrogenase (NADP+)